MIDHVSIGIREIARGKRFYDACLAPLGYTCLTSSETALGYGDDTVALWLNLSTHPVEDNPESGLHFCFTAPTRGSVDEFHRESLAAGGRDNGKPGLRSEYGDHYYAAFAVDPDGYRIEAYCDRLT